MIRLQSFELVIFQYFFFALWNQYQIWNNWDCGSYFYHQRKTIIFPGIEFDLYFKMYKHRKITINQLAIFGLSQSVIKITFFLSNHKRKPEKFGLLTDREAWKKYVWQQNRYINKRNEKFQKKLYQRNKRILIISFPQNKIQLLVFFLSFSSFSIYIPFIL